MAAVGMVLSGRYRLLDVLGDGGMARVFRAQDQRLGRVVAVKILHQHYVSQVEFVRRFEQEAQLAAGLSHPNIVAIYDVGRDGDTYFIVMEYVEGSALKELIVRQAPLPLDRVIPIMRQIGLALDFAHEHGVIHRDIKPENILLTPSDQVKVGDFGIARALTSAGQTATGMVLGSVSYFSPEQAQGKPATAAADLYSSGIVLYEMLTGHLPFSADHPLATAMQHITQQPPPPRASVPSLPPAVDDVVLKALSKNPAGRFRSGAVLADALTGAAQTPPDRSRTPPKRLPARDANARATTVRTPRVTAAGAAPRRRSPVAPLLLAVALGGGVYAAYTHRHDIGVLLAGGNAGTATATPPTLTPTPGTSPGGTTTPGAVAGLPSATATNTPQPATATATTAPSPTSTPTAAPSTSPSPTPSATPTARSGANQLSAVIETAAGYAYDVLHVPHAVHRQDTFSLSAAQAVAVIHIRNYPKGARVGARWTFPDGKSYDTYIPDRFDTYWVQQDFNATGHYTVSALVNGRVVGAHGFIVTPDKAVPAAGTPGATGVPPTVAAGVPAYILAPGS